MRFFPIASGRCFRNICISLVWSWSESRKLISSRVKNVESVTVAMNRLVPFPLFLLDDAFQLFVWQFYRFLE